MEPATKAKRNLILRIVKRAQWLGIARGSQLTQVLDVEAACDQFNLRLEELVEANNAEFTHDFYGIQQYMNRKTGKVEGYFSPRFAGKNKEENK